MAELAMAKEKGTYSIAKDYMDTIKCKWFFGEIEFRKESVELFNERLKAHPDLYNYFVNPIKKKLGIQRELTEEEMNGYLANMDFEAVFHDMLDDIKKNPARAKQDLEKVKRVINEILPDDLRASLEQNKMVGKALRVIVKH